MASRLTTQSLEHTFQNVKPAINSQLPLFPDSMIHHKANRHNNQYIVLNQYAPLPSTYGVSQTRRILSPQLLFKRFDMVRDCLKYTIGLTTGQREVVLRLLRFWAYYGQVYTKEATITTEPGCHKATYWRTVRRLRDLGLVTVINRYFIRPHAQTSNLYRFDKLLLLLARYLAEHGVQFYQKWLRPALSMPGSEFWPWVFATSGNRRIAPPGSIDYWSQCIHS